MRPQIHSHTKQLTQVMLATLLVAGMPVAAVWWLRESGTVDSAMITLALGVAISLLTSAVARFFWERNQGSEDLLFNELMVWGYLHRLRTQRRIGDVAELAAPLSAHAPSGAPSDPALVRAQTRLLERLVAGMETRDPYLHGHSRRVARHASMIARHMRLPAEQVARVRTAAALHDVGKTKTPKTILHKAGPLTDEEYRIIKLHPGEGAEMADVLGDAELSAMIRHHHERLDGSGYPDGLAAKEIPLGARIIAVADTFDAITSARAYRAASPHRRAIAILNAEAGTQLDPDVVRAFCGHYAGRGPLALWSFVCSLPERMLSWLSASAASVASVAKVAAVAALVGGVAATTSTIGNVGGSNLRGHSHESASTHEASSSPAPVLAATVGVRHASALERRSKPGSASHHRTIHHSAPGVAPHISTTYTPTTGAADHGSDPAPAGGTDHHGENEGTTARGGEVAGGKGTSSTPVGGEAPKPVRQETPAKGNGQEAPPKGKNEEAPGQGKVEEHPAPAQPEEPRSKPEEPSGKGAPGSGKPEAEAGGGKGQGGGPH